MAGNTTGRKSDKVESERRVNEVVNLILECKSVKEIIDYCEENFCIKARAAYKYIKKAYKIISSLPTDDLEEKKALHIERRMKLYRDLTDKSKPSGARTALRILDSVAKIDGSLVEKVDVTTKGEQLTSTVVMLPQNGREGK